MSWKPSTEFDVGNTYINDVTGRPFVHFMAEAKWCEVVYIFGKADFFSFLIYKGTCITMAMSWCYSYIYAVILKEKTREFTQK